MPPVKPRPSSGKKTAESATRVVSFPENAANDLINIASIVTKATEVKKAVDQARDMKPDEKSINIAAQKWYDASQSYNDSRSGLIDSWNSLGAYWGGPAYTAFSNYMQSDVTSVCEDNANTLFNIGDALVDLYNTVALEYADAVAYIGQTLTRAAPLKTGASEGHDEQFNALWDICADFVGNMQDRKSKLIAALATRAAAMSKLEGQIKQLREPGEFPSGAKDKNQWKPST